MGILVFIISNSVNFIVSENLRIIFQIPGSKPLIVCPDGGFNLNFGIFALFLGSQIPIYETRSDGRDNFQGALIMAAKFVIPEVVHSDIAISSSLPSVQVVEIYITTVANCGTWCVLLLFLWLCVIVARLNNRNYSYRQYALLTFIVELSIKS